MSIDLSLREPPITAKFRWRAVLVLFGLMLLSSAAVAAETAAYTGVKPDEFMKHWLVLGPIPVSAEQFPDEDAQKKAFADDLLKPAAGESVVQPRAGAKVVIGGKNYEWRQVEHSTPSWAVTTTVWASLR
jgi:hypothetical protein